MTKEGIDIHQIKILRRNVNRNVEVVAAGGFPFKELLEREPPDIAVYFYNHAVLFKNGNEFRRGHNALVRVLPAHKCFRADGLAFVR